MNMLSEKSNSLKVACVFVYAMDRKIICVKALA